MIEVNSEKELDDLLDALGREIVSTRFYNDLYRDLVDSIEEFEREFNQSRTFWSLALDSLNDARLLRLCRIFDGNPKTLNLKTFLLAIQNNSGWFCAQSFRKRVSSNSFVEPLSKINRTPEPSQLNADIEIVSNDDPLVKKLTLWRNHIVAHKDPGVVLKKKKIIENNPISESEIHCLLERALDVFNRYSQLFRASIHSPTIVGKDDFEQMLRLVRLGIKNSDEMLS